MEAHSPGYLTGRPFVQKISTLGRFVLERLSLPVKSADHLLSVEERVAIGPKKTLMLVNCAGRRFLVATAGDAIAPMIEVRPLRNGGASSEPDVQNQPEGAAL